MVAMCVRSLTSLLAPGVGGRVPARAEGVAVAGQGANSAAQGVGALVILCCRVLVVIVHRA